MKRREIGDPHFDIVMEKLCTALLVFLTMGIVSLALFNVGRYVEHREMVVAEVSNAPN